MRYGQFSKDGLEYRVTTPFTPTPWVNHLVNKTYAALVSTTGGGYSFVYDSAYNRILREVPVQNLTSDFPGRYIFVRDQDSGKFWSLTFQPTKNPYQRFLARHGLGYTAVEQEIEGVESQVVYFVPVEGNYEVWKVNLINNSPRPRKFRFFTYVEFCLGNYVPDLIENAFSSFFNRSFYQKGIILATKNRWERPATQGDPWDKFAFITLSESVDQFETSRRLFLGPLGDVARPQAVALGKLSSKAWQAEDLVGSLSFARVLKAGENFSFFVILGVVEEKKQAEEIKRYLLKDGLKNEEEKLKNFWQRYLKKVWVKTPDPTVNLWLNIWGKYQTYVNAIWSEMDSYYIGGGGVFGFRDTAQHIWAVAPFEPSLYEDRLIFLLSHQFQDGSVPHAIRLVNDEPIVTEHSDDAQWLVFSLLNFLDETGDLSFLLRRLPFFDQKEREASVLEHAKAALDFTLRHVSDRGLPLHRTADWNDALAGGRLGKGESLLVTGLLCFNLKRFAGLLKMIGKTDLSGYYLKLYKNIAQVVNKECWDGGWYIRATGDKGEIIGSKKSVEGKIFLDGNSLLLLSGIVPDDRQIKTLDSLWENLMTKFGPMIFYPAFTHKNAALGIISQFLPGAKENAAIFHHPSAWMMVAECLAGRGEKALEIFKRTCPMRRSLNPELYQVEPFVYTEFAFGRESDKFGQGSFSWVTGSAEWFFRGLLDFLLGIKPTLKGLVVDPCIPKEWKGFEAKRIFRETVYQIVVKNPKGVRRGVKKIKVDGKEISGQLLPVLEKGEHKVEVEMG